MNLFTLRNFVIWPLIGFCSLFGIVFVSELIPALSLGFSWSTGLYYASISGFKTALVLLIVGLISLVYIKKEIQEFFKPNIKKIVLFVCIFGMSIGAGFLTIHSVPSEQNLRVLSVLEYPNHLLQSNGILGNVGWPLIPYFQNSFYILLLAVVIWEYIFTCTLIEFFERFFSSSKPIHDAQDQESKE